MAIVYTGGTFDLFHAGHANFLRQCSKIAGYSLVDTRYWVEGAAAIGGVVVALNTDEFVTSYKGTAPVYSYEERKRILESCKYVYKVVPNTGGPDSKITINYVRETLSLKPDFIVIGSDWACKDYYAQMGFTQEWLDKQDIGLIYVPYTEGISTTGIKKSVRTTLEYLQHEWDKNA